MEFVSPDPHATVRAANVRATLDAFKLVPSVGLNLIRKHKLSLDDLTPDRYVLVQRWLDALREVQAQVGSGVVRAVGASIIENAEFPPSFDSVGAVLTALDNIYYLNHRGDVGHYHVSRSPDGVFTVRCETPYPRAFEHGLIEGICRSKIAGSKRFAIDFADGPANTDVTCTLTVRERQPR